VILMAKPGRPRIHFAPETVALMRADVADLASDPQHSLRLLMRISAGFARATAQVRRRADLGNNEWAALIALWDGGRCTMTELGERIDISRAAITTLADRLNSIGLIERVPDPSDRRRLFVTVTPRFEDMLFEVLEPIQPALDDLIAADPTAWKAFGGVGAQLRGLLTEEATHMRDLPKLSHNKKSRDLELEEAHW
jgi:DNA-binding MarR family transcriptional regulator